MLRRHEVPEYCPGSLGRDSLSLDRVGPAMMSGAAALVLRPSACSACQGPVDGGVLRIYLLGGGGVAIGVSFVCQA